MFSRKVIKLNSGISDIEDSDRIPTNIQPLHLDHLCRPITFTPNGILQIQICIQTQNLTTTDLRNENISLISLHPTDLGKQRRITQHLYALLRMKFHLLNLLFLRAGEQ